MSPEDRLRPAVQPSGPHEFQSRTVGRSGETRVDRGPCRSPSRRVSAIDSYFPDNIECRDFLSHPATGIEPM